MIDFSVQLNLCHSSDVHCVTRLMERERERERESMVSSDINGTVDTVSKRLHSQGPCYLLLTALLFWRRLVVTCLFVLLLLGVFLLLLLFFGWWCCYCCLQTSATILCGLCQVGTIHNDINKTQNISDDIRHPKTVSQVLVPLIGSWRFCADGALELFRCPWRRDIHQALVIQ